MWAGYLRRPLKSSDNFCNMEELIRLDKELLLALNGSDSVFWDNFMSIHTSTLTWIPLLVAILYVVIKNNAWREALLVCVMVGLVVLLADRISSGFFKPFFHRFRPTHDPEIMQFVDIVDGRRGGKYGFLSSHAANSFGVVTFLALLFRQKLITGVMVLWALLNCYTRIYLGLHFPGDILCGILLGVLTGWCVYRLYLFARKKLLPSASAAPTAYAWKDTRWIVVVLALTYLYITARSFAG